MRITLILLLLILSNCSDEPDELNPVGTYHLEVQGIRSIDSGMLEIGGENDDYFGRLTFTGSRNREYSVGMEFLSADSMSFYLAGGGYLRIARRDTNWIGEFKYFGLNGDIIANINGDLDNYRESEFERITKVKPISWGIISTSAQETFPSFDPVRKELYFTRSSGIYSSVKMDQSWSEPVLLPFSNTYNYSAPYLSDDGNTLVFTSNRPLEESGETTRNNVWSVNRDTEGNWAEPKIYPEPINIDSLGDYHAAISANNSLYFVSYNRDGGFGRSDLYKAIESNSEYLVENLGPTINTEFSEADVYIDPEERFLLFISTSREDTFGADDIYITVNSTSGWSEPENLGKSVNTFAYEYGPWIDPINKKFYFNSDRRGSADIYSIDIDQIPVLLPFFE